MVIHVAYYRSVFTVKLQFIQFFMENFQKLSRAEMKGVLGGVAQGPDVYSCSAQTDCCGTVTYSTTDQTSAQLWYNFYAAAKDNPTCTIVKTYDA